MKHIAHFIIKFHKVFLIVMVLIGVACALLIPQVGINGDMTKYLANDSNMKIGMDLMDEELAATETDSVVRVMFANLDSAQKDEILQTLEGIDYVDSVDYEADSEDYNRDYEGTSYTLYVVNTKYDYSTKEEKSIEKAIRTGFPDYDMSYKNEDSSAVNLPAWVVTVALVILFAILVIMSNSWVEPFLFVITIGIAVAINMGTNIIMGEVSNITFSIGALLQLVLSMDYSIILMNRYRQEFAKTQDKTTAMQSALTMSFSSVAGSAVTTIVGLLMLVFMSFKIGMDLGIVLAKGVFISMICVFTVLPGLVLLTHNGIMKSTKKVPNIPLFHISGGIYRVRYIFIPLLCVLFVGAWFLQKNTNVSYNLKNEFLITDVFPLDNSIVMLYNNEDEDQIDALASQFGDYAEVKSATSYPTLLGKPYTAEEMADNLTDLTGDADGMDLSADLLSILYYDYFAGEDLPELTASELIHFLAEDVAENDTFADYLGDDVRDNLDMMEQFADADALTMPMTAAELADFFGMEESDIQNVLLYYYIVHGGVDSGTMTLPVFADFVVNELADDPDYGDFFDADTLAMMDTLTTYTDAAAMTTPRSYESMADLMGMDRADMKMLYIYYYAMQEDYTPGIMTIPSFISLVCDDLASQEAFSSYFNADTLYELNTLRTYLDTDLIQTQMDAAALSDFFGMGDAEVQNLLLLYEMTQGDADTGTMTLPDFADFVVNEIAADDTYSAMFDADTPSAMQMLQTFTNVSAMTAPMDASSMAAALASVVDGLDADSARLLCEYAYYEAGQGTLSMQQMVDFLADNTDTFGSLLGDQAATLTLARQIIDASVAGTAYTSDQMAALMGMDASQSRQLYLLYISRHGDISSWTLSPVGLVDFILQDVASDATYGAMFDADTLAELGLLQTLMHSALQDTAYDYASLAKLFGMDADTMKILFTYQDAQSKGSSWTLSVQTVVNYLVGHQDDLGDLLGDNLSDLALAQKIINGSVAGTAYTDTDLANLLGMEEDQCHELYLLYISRHGDTAAWAITVQQFVEFVQTDVLSNPDYADLMDSETADELDTASTLIDAVVSGKAYTSDEMCELFAGLSDDLDSNTMALLYLYYAGLYDADPDWALSIDDMVSYLADDLLADPRFSLLLDDDYKEEITDLRTTLQDGISQMKGEHYAILAFTTTFAVESEETMAFIEELMAYADANLSGDYYLIGESPMIYEMQQGFAAQLRLITWLTAISIFIVVAITFRNLLIPLILVVIVQCGVYLTISTCGLIGYNIYYLALLIVQCILMGATIDYGILYTNYYREYRWTMDRPQAIREAYKGASHTIFTSGLIMILVTGIIGFSPAEATISQICLTISMGVLAAVLLIVLILPGILATADRLVVKRKK